MGRQTGKQRRKSFEQKRIEAENKRLEKLQERLNWYNKNRVELLARKRDAGRHRKGYRSTLEEKRDLESKRASREAKQTIKETGGYQDIEAVDIQQGELWGAYSERMDLDGVKIPKRKKETPVEVESSTEKPKVTEPEVTKPEVTRNRRGRVINKEKGGLQTPSPILGINKKSSKSKASGNNSNFNKKRLTVNQARNKRFEQLFGKNRSARFKRRMLMSQAFMDM
tara:strand:+ start:90 stop:764 length:675 start_codon:yes stop_codon:yes gene_type:complete